MVVQFTICLYQATRDNNQTKPPVQRNKVKMSIVIVVVLNEGWTMYVYLKRESFLFHSFEQTCIVRKNETRHKTRVKSNEQWTACMWSCRIWMFSVCFFVYLFVRVMLTLSNNDAGQTQTSSMLRLHFQCAIFISLLLLHKMFNMQLCCRFSYSIFHSIFHVTWGWWRCRGNAYAYM